MLPDLKELLRIGEWSPDTMRTILAFKTLKETNAPPAFSRQYGERFSSPENFLKMKEYLKDHQMRLVTYLSNSEGTEKMAFFGDGPRDRFVFFCRYGGHNDLYYMEASSSVSSRDLEDICQAREEFSEPVKTADTVGLVGSGPNGLFITSIEAGGVPVISTNYSQVVMEQYDYVARQLASPNPNGRIVLLSGEPGTGKTFLVRGLIHDLTQSGGRVVLLPPDLVAGASAPAMIPLLIDYHRQRPTSPIIFLIEDGDSCLVRRGADSMSSLSSLLNISDGILGRLMDIRIIVTTNAKTSDIDHAILRPGRLLQAMRVQALTSEEATLAFRSLEGRTEGPLESVPLAEVYAKLSAQLQGREEEARKLRAQSRGNIQMPRKMGFEP